MQDIDNPENKSKRGGWRPGSGRPKGSMNAETIERMKVKAAFVQRINKHADDLFNAQFNLAKGETYLMVKRTEGEGKNRRVWHETVSDPQVIIKYLDGELEGGESIDDDEHFYYMTTKPANGMAIDSMLNRSFGKAEESLKLGEDPENPIGRRLSELSDEELDERIARYLAHRKTR